MREALAKALDELRIISLGLSLPDLDGLDPRSLVECAVNDHNRQTGLTAPVDLMLPKNVLPDNAQTRCVLPTSVDLKGNAAANVVIY